MNSTVYIESINKFPSDDWSCSAYLGFRANGASIKLFEDIKEVPLNRYTVLVASIENTHKWMEDMGWNIPESMTLPEQLNTTHWTGRNIKKMTLGEALEIKEYPYFIKSFELKKFIPGVINKKDDTKWLKGLGSGAPEANEAYNTDIPVLVSDVMEFAAEYRVYVLDHKIVGCCYYGGDMRYYPDFNVVEDMVLVYDRSPIAYSLDVGVVKSGKHLTFTNLVECNPFYSLGNYGLSPKLYTRCLTAYWRQLLEQNPVKL